jgi:hypothetical protein
MQIHQTGCMQERTEMTHLIKRNALESGDKECFTVNMSKDLGRIFRIMLSKEKTDDWANIALLHNPATFEHEIRNT